MKAPSTQPTPVDFDTVAHSLVEQARTPEQRKQLEQALVFEETKSQLDVLRGQQFSAEALQHIPELLEALEKYKAAEIPAVLQHFFESIRQQDHTVWTHFLARVKEDWTSVATGAKAASTLGGSMIDYARGKRLESEITTTERQQVWDGLRDALRHWATTEGVPAEEAARMEFATTLEKLSPAEQKLWRESVVISLQLGKTPEQVVKDIIEKKGKGEIRAQLLLEGDVTSRRLKKNQITLAEIM